MKTSGLEVRQDRTGDTRDEELVILVDATGDAIGAAEKKLVHQFGMRHRAFSIFLVDDKRRVVLQQRHPSKYHSGGLWANSCCGHPRPGESTAAAAARRLQEELGVRVPLQFGFCTSYAAALGNGLTENEIVSVFFGQLRTAIRPNADEISRTRLMQLPALVDDIAKRPQIYAYWVKHYFEHHGAEIAALCGRLAKLADSAAEESLRTA